VVLSDVTKLYFSRSPVAALRGVTLEVGEGELLAVMGPSGSGKSTLLNLMGGLDVPSSGEVIVAGENLGRLTEDARSRFRSRHVSYVFQSGHLMTTLTAAQNVALPLHLLGVGRAEVRRRVACVLDEVGLAGRSEHLPDELSGGERQRVAIARALVTDPRLVLADEPTGNLDSTTGEQILALFHRAHEERQATIVIVTHDSRAGSQCDRVVGIRDGRVDSERA
jgi:putative ABC transport system ATP-binding protein